MDEREKPSSRINSGKSENHQSGLVVMNMEVMTWKWILKSERYVELLGGNRTVYYVVIPYSLYRPRQYWPHSP